MRKKLMALAAPALLAGAFIVPAVSATPAAADPPCAMDVYGDTSGERGYAIDVTLNRCDRPTRAIVKCGYPGGSGIERGSTITTGHSEATCSRNAIMSNYGWEVYYNGGWNPRWQN